MVMLKLLPAMGKQCSRENRRSERMSLIVVDDYIQKYDIIVGRTFTDCENVSFIKTKDRLLFTYGMRFPFEEEDNICDNLVKYDAKIVRDTEILPAKSASMVEVEVNNEQIEIMLIVVNPRKHVVHLLSIVLFTH
jgi:hypothetical protein